MVKYLSIGLGGFFGAIARVLLKSVVIVADIGQFPLNTFLINIAGSFLLSFILTVAFEGWRMNADLRMGLTTGLLGAFTTFSTFCKESVGLMRSGALPVALLYMAGSVAAGLFAAYLGVVLAREMGTRLAGKETENDGGEGI